VAAASPLLARLAIPAIRWVTLIGALILGPSMTAESFAARMPAPPHDGPIDVARAGWPTPSSPVARLMKIRAGHRTSVALHFPRPRLYDPSDDEASDDPTDDDDNWEDVSAVDNSTELVVAWFPVMVRYLTAHEVGSAPLRTETPSSPFLAPQHLRC
jgi:hypothetical protein